MFQAVFIFRAGAFDAEFEALNAEVGARAAAIDGFLGEEAWRSPDGLLRQAVYFWSDRDSLDQFVRDDVHKSAKSRQAEWYEGYHVIISEIVDTYGDGRLPHVTGDARQARRRTLTLRT